MSEASPKTSQPSLPPSEGHPGVAIASLILSLLALSAILITISPFFNQSNSGFDGNGVIDTLRVPCISFLWVSGVAFGFISLAEKSGKKVFAVLGLLISLLPVLAFCCMFGVVIVFSDL